MDNTARLCVMNLYLHGIGARTELGASPIHVADSLRRRPGRTLRHGADQSALRQEEQRHLRHREGEIKREAQTIVREDFWTSTSNKQLNFVQHVKNHRSKINGRAAVVVPDNVLFEGGAGETVRRKLLHECDVHTLLRLPTGIFYAQGVKANVLFFDRKPGQRDALDQEALDLRPAHQHALHPQDEPAQPGRPGRVRRLLPPRQPPRAHRHLVARQIPDGRWRAYAYDELLARDKVNLDIFWLRDESLEDSANLPDPDVLAAEIVEDLQAALEQFRGIDADLAGEE